MVLLPSSSVAAVSHAVSAPPAALAPGSYDAEKFDLGVDSEGDDSDVVCPYIQSTHLLWRASVLGKDGFPVSVDCLLDNGAHLVLIRPETVADLDLTMKKLAIPIEVFLAIHCTESNSLHSITTLSNYVELFLLSLNNIWHSYPVKALVALGLCTNVLLGLPWLEWNNIVIDHGEKSAINKKSGFDILDTTIPVHMSCQPEPKMESTPQEIVLHCRKLMLEELRWVV